MIRFGQAVQAGLLLRRDANGIRLLLDRQFSCCQLQTVLCFWQSVFILHFFLHIEKRIASDKAIPTALLSPCCSVSSSSCCTDRIDGVVITSRQVSCLWGILIHILLLQINVVVMQSAIQTVIWTAGKKYLLRLLK